MREKITNLSPDGAGGRAGAPLGGGGGLPVAAGGGGTFAGGGGGLAPNIRDECTMDSKIVYLLLIEN